MTRSYFEFQEEKQAAGAGEPAPVTFDVVEFFDKSGIAVVERPFTDAEWAQITGQGR